MDIKVFGLPGSEAFAHRVATPISDLTYKRFDDGEIYIRSNENVRGSDVYIIHSLYGDDKLSASEKLATLLFFAGSLKDASAARVTAVMPYLSFARQDKKTQSRAPLTLKYVAKMLEAVGVDRVLTMDVHSLAGCQNAFRIPTDNLEARPLFVEWLTGYGKDCLKISEPQIKRDDWEKVVILSPDAGGMSRARWFRDSLEKRLKNSIFPRGINLDIAYFDKQRLNDGKVLGGHIVGNVKGKKVLLIDDLISTGTTVEMAGKTIENEGGEVFAIFATHGLFIGDAQRNLQRAKHLVISDTIPPFRLKSHNVTIVSTTSMFASAISRTHQQGGSISELLED